jgi:hypothetical protein
VLERLSGSERAPARSRQFSGEAPRRQAGVAPRQQGGSDRRQGTSGVQGHRTRVSDGGSRHSKERKPQQQRCLYPGAKFQNFCLANFHVAVASPSLASRLAETTPAASRSVSLARLYFRSRWPTPMWLQPLLVRHVFSAGWFKFVVLSSFREAFELSKSQPHQLEVEEDGNSNFKSNLGGRPSGRHPPSLPCVNQTVAEGGSGSGKRVGQVKTPLVSVI